MQRYDGEIGRGRRRSSNDSSSSRDSSPDLVRKRQRQFSPAASDGGEDPVPPNIQIHPLPPQEKPLIRQAVAFASDQQPQNIDTYEAAPPQILRGFLPGQQPVFPKPAKVPKEKPALKKPRRLELYTSQTTRFRVDSYDPTPSTEPPIAHGNGPYSSLFRGSVAPANRGPDTSVEILPPSDRLIKSTPSMSSQPPGMPVHTMSSARHPPQAALPAPAPVETHPMNRTVSNTQQQHYAPGARPMPPRVSTSSVPPHQPPNHYPRHIPQPPPGPSHYTPSPYYRNDYDKGVWGVNRQDATPPPRDMQETPRQNRSHNSASSRQSNTESSFHDQDNDPGSSKQKAPLRMVTLLIQDVRSGTTDHQLAEVKVPLRLADNQGTGFWADARAVCEQLQQGPSRVDGPARVYTLRGKYRQFVLRVSEDNIDALFSCNIAVQGDRTVDLVVETLAPPGARPQPPKIPQELLDAYGQGDDSSSDQMDIDVEEAHNMGGSRKRLTSPSFDDYDGPDPPSPSKKSSRARYPRVSTGNSDWTTQYFKPSKTQNSSSSSPSKRRRPSPLQQPPHGSRADDPPLPPSPQANEAVFLKMLQKYVQDHDPSGYREYFRSSVGYDVSDLLRQYEFLSKAIGHFVGKPLSAFEEGAYEDVVEEVHILKLMKIKDEAVLEDCKETMKLLALYGDEGLPQYDPRITEMIKRKVKEEHKEQTRRDFLQLLRDVDQKWTKRPKPDERSRKSSEESGAEVTGEEWNSKD